ncbi:hypothetical protein B0T10DRAFT_492147 [Thelonectria olida]|uniref:Uncharacterized protein n=1 Tax=Thelonectria olida TaxID=1576542 RepID=A0A9P9ALQ6_9HYPO|nr:hypothetical protein B0T10DRAFT_492147 [Thelonectria olida]
MKFSVLSVAALAVFAPIAEAKNCQKGLTYCGYVLLRRGNYYNQISAELRANGQSTDSNWVNHSLFKCLGGNNGDISYIKHCSSCQDGGDNNNDFC